MRSRSNRSMLEGTRAIGKTVRLRVPTLFVAAILGCRVGDQPPVTPGTPLEPSPPPPVVRETYGSVQVTTRTVGTDLDPDGYIVQTDGYWDYSHQPVAIGINGTVMLRTIAAGQHTLTLYELSPNCTGEHLDGRPVVVVADSVVAVEFQISCGKR